MSHLTAIRLLTTTCMAIVLAAAPAWAQTAMSGPWSLGLGITLPAIQPTTGDFGTEALRPTLNTSGLTFPRVTFARALGECWAVELGYRKLGVLAFRTANGTVDGNTHSNQGKVGLRRTVAELGAVAIRVHAGVGVVRTIATLERAPDDWPIAGDTNTWHLAPALSLSAAWRVRPRWTLSAEFEPLLGRLGTATDTGRYRQQALGVDLTRSW